MNSLKIRVAQEKDTKELAALMRSADYRPEEWSLPKIKKYLRKEGHTILLALEGGKIRGYVGLKEVENEDDLIRTIIGDNIDSCGCVEWIAVHLSHRGKGVASRLLKSAEIWARKRKRKGVWLDCRASVIPLYEKNGYDLVGSYEGRSKANRPAVKYVFLKKF